MKPFRKVYELTFKSGKFYVHTSYELFGFVLSKKLMKSFRTPEPAVKYIKSLK